MRLPLVVCSRRGRALAGALVWALLSATGVAPAVAAEGDAEFSATVHVDASADNPEKARELARVDGERRALAAVVARLSGTAEAPLPAKLDERAITDMVDSFEVAGEHMSAVRYLADYTFHFKPAKVRPLVRTAGAAPPAASPDATGGAVRPPSVTAAATLLLPIFRDGGELLLWNDPGPNPWQAAWAEAAGAAHLELALGDIGDITAIDARRADAGDAAALAAIAQRNGAAEVVVALAATRRRDGRLAGLNLSLRRYRGGRLVDARTRSLDADPGEGEGALLQRAAAAVAADLGSKSAAAGDQAATLAAVVPISGLGDWIVLRQQLGAVAGIRGLDVLALSHNEATIAIHYVGGPDMLKSSLAASAFALAGGEPLWRLERSAAKRP